jgi:hypothetical protein
MLSLEITENDKNWLKERYPALTITSRMGGLVIVGLFNFDAVYNSCTIADSYDVEIELKANELSALPRVRETRSRIKNVAKSRNIDLTDLHTYDDGTACLCVKPDEASYFPDGFSFQTFVEKLVVPFFYAQSFFEQKNSWPWATYSHGSLGWLEWYADQEFTAVSITTNYVQGLQAQHDWRKIHRALTRKGGPKSYRLCFCGSAKSYWNCHRKAFQGLLRLTRDMKSFEVKP